MIDHGRGAEVWDVDGNRFIDFNAGIAVNATGHCHPAVVEAIKAQAEKFLHYSGTDFYYPVQIELAEKLTQLAPISEPSLVFFTNSGAEAVEAAIKLARYTTGRQRLVAFRGAFHGRTMGALSLTASKYVQRQGFAPLMPGVEHVDYGYCYRCPVNLTYPGCGIECVRRIDTEVFRTNVPPQEVAAILSLIHISEPTRPYSISYAVFCLKQKQTKQKKKKKIYSTTTEQRYYYIIIIAQHVYHINTSYNQNPCNSK